MINLNDKFYIRFQADIFDHGSSVDVIVKDDVTFTEAIEFLNERDIPGFCVGGRGLKNRISVGGGHLRRLGWYESEEYHELIRQGKLEVTDNSAKQNGT